MPSVMEDPFACPLFRRTGEAPFLTHLSPLPIEIVPRQVTLRDRATTATLVPFPHRDEVPPALLSYVCTLMNREIEAGDTYPMMDPMTVDAFANYWFGTFAAIMFLGDARSVGDLMHSLADEKVWERYCLGSFYIKPNYPGRSSHVCNGGFLVGPLARNRGVGRLMGEGYLEWAPKLGYTYSVFNLVYETNAASCRIWDSLGFKRIGRVKGCGSLRSYPDQLIDAIQYGRDLGPEGEDYASEDRFDKIRYYLKHGKYPDGADRAEKSRLRSAATHYRLMLGTTDAEDKLMLKDKEVISDPGMQLEIARQLHEEHHAGINKTTAAIADKYHWIGIKTSVSSAIRNCAECHDSSNSLQSRNDEFSLKRNNIAPGQNQSAFTESGPSTTVTHAQDTNSLESSQKHGYSPSLTVDPTLTQVQSRGEHPVGRMDKAQ